MRKIIITLALGSVISCSGGGWSSAQKDYYVDICSSGGYVSEAYCKCTLKKIINGGYSPEDNIPSSAIERYAQQCAYLL